jgi:hypothetical protein
LFNFALLFFFFGQKFKKKKKKFEFEMKVFSFLLLAALLCNALATAQHHLSDYEHEEFLLEHHWVKKLDDGSVHDVRTPLQKGVAFSSTFWRKFMALADTNGTSSTSGLRESYFDFLPAQLTSLGVNASLPFAWSGLCFEHLSASFGCNDTHGWVHLEAGKRRSLTCSELYSFADREASHYKVLEVGGKHRIEFALEQYELGDVKLNGLGVYLWPLGLRGSAVSVKKTLSAFLYGPERADNARDMLSERLQWRMEKRVPNVFVNVSADDIPDGSPLFCAYPDGLDSLISLGTGSYAGHTTFKLTDEQGEPIICESTDTPSVAHPYWPPPYGLGCRPYNTWMRDALAADYRVVIMPLKAGVATHFDNAKALEFVRRVYGQPYGYYSFIFSFMDTLTDNLPRPISPSLLSVFFGFAERALPIDSKTSVYNMLVRGLNKRMQTDCKTLQCIYDVADPKGMSLVDIMIIPDQQNWTYGGNYSFVCSAFATAVLEAGGVFDYLGVRIEATEFTPRDLYQFDIFELDWRKLPRQCIEASATLPFCQIMGDYQFLLPGAGSITPYSHANERCPSLIPQLYRPQGC